MYWYCSTHVWSRILSRESLRTDGLKDGRNSNSSLGQLPRWLSCLTLFGLAYSRVPTIVSSPVPEHQQESSNIKPRGKLFSIFWHVLEKTSVLGGVMKPVGSPAPMCCLSYGGHRGRECVMGEGGAHMLACPGTLVCGSGRRVCTSMGSAWFMEMEAVTQSLWGGGGGSYDILVAWAIKTGWAGWRVGRESVWLCHLRRPGSEAGVVLRAAGLRLPNVMRYSMFNERKTVCEGKWVQRLLRRWTQSTVIFLFLPSETPS